jgi:hypothetical protein
MAMKFLVICAALTLAFCSFPSNAEPEGSNAERAADKQDRRETLQANRDKRDERANAKVQRERLKNSKSKQGRKIKC